MGGIKNKLSKLTSRVKTLFNNAANNLGSSARGAVERSETEGLTIPLSDYRLTSPFSQRGTKSSLPLAKGRQMSVAHRWGRYTKYLSIACLSLAILSTLILNIVSSYSSSKIESNAEPATQANGPLVSGPATISLSITPLTTPTSSPCDTSNSNICMKIPDEGGIATGGHTIKVSSNSYAGYNVLLSASEANNDETSLVNTANNTWGYVLTNPTGQETNAIWAGLQPSTHKTAIATTGSLSNQTDNYSVYYGVKVDNPSQLLAGDYQTQVVYTATVKLPSKPTITSVSPNQYELGSNGNSTVTIEGTNLASTYSVYLTNTNGDKVGDCTNLGVADDTQLTCTMPTDQTNPDLEPGDYTIHVVTQGGEETIGFSYTKKTLPDGILESTDDYGDDGHVAVDYDENLIPVVYDESSQAWRVVTNAELQQDLKNWYDYTTKQWANALTVADNTEDASYQVSSDGKTYCLNYGIFHCERDPSATTMTPLEFLKYARDNNISDVTIIEDYVLGYWVYIPRYAYKVMRKEVADKVVTDDEAKNNGKGGFEIVFETSSDIVKEPAVCNNSNANQYYQDCIKSQYGDAGIDYPGNSRELSDKTAWATHPAFTWQYTQEINGFDKTYELNGIWVGKFETTGSTEQPTVLPNQYIMSGGANVGDGYDIAKEIGVSDPNNLYGNSNGLDSGSEGGSHNLFVSPSHMLKNSEWGAVVYLSASKYGAGVNNVRMNMSYQNSGGAGSITGEGLRRGAYNTADSMLASTTNNIYGIYDMAGGAWEYVMGSYVINALQSSNSYFSNAAKPPYVDLYVSSPFNGTRFTNNNLCTWTTCGGHALYEVKTKQLVTDIGQSWGGSESGSDFVYESAPWFMRSSSSLSAATTGVFSSFSSNGGQMGNAYIFRVALLAVATK